MAIPPDPRQPGKPAAAPTSSGKKTLTYSIAPGSKPAAAPTTGGTSGGLAGIASARAAQETQAAIAGYRALQDYANQQGMLRAAQQGQLGIAASKYLEGLDLPGRTTSDYAAAAAAQREAASGYSGGLQQTVSDAAAEVQRNLAAGGSPQTAYNQGEAAGNALYALGGALPATQFGVTGPTVAAGLRALPAQTLGYAQQLALGQLGAGQQEAAKYNADITGLLAKQPTLAASYLDTLSAAQAKAQADAVDAAYKQGQLRISSFKANAAVEYQNAKLNIDAAKAQSLDNYRSASLTNDAARITETSKHNQALEKLSEQNAANLEAYRNNQIDLGTFNANTSRINSATSRINAQTSRLNALKPPTAKGLQSVTLPNGRAAVFDPNTGGYKLLPKSLGKQPKPPKQPRLTLKQRQAYTAEINETVSGLKIGGTDKDGVEHPALNNSQAWLYLQSQGYLATPELAAIAKAAIRSAYGSLYAPGTQPSGPK